MKNTEEKKYIEYEKTKPEQLDLFSFNNIFPDKKEKYSGTVELYDILPKYIHDDVESLRKDGKYLDIVSRDFIYRKHNMQVIISPARILQEDKTSKDFFPSQREEIIEDVLRKFATNSKRNEFLDNRLSVKFTLYDLWKELRKIKHPYDYNQIRESLKILARTNIEIKGINGETTFSSNMFETFGIIDCNTNLEDVENFDNNEEQQKEYNKKVIYFVRFNSLVSESIKNKTWRIINYDQCMQYKRAVSRWLHKRISHLFISRSIELPYNIMLSTIIRDSGMTMYDRINMNLIQVQKCLTEMIEVGSIDRYEMEKIYDSDKTNKLVDVKFLIYISHSFFEDLKLNNLVKNEKKILIIENNNKNYEEFKEELKQQLKSYNLVEKDYDSIISFIKKEEDIEIIRKNIKEAVNYINKQIEVGKSCNPIAIITSSIKNDWKNNDLLEIQQDNIREYDMQNIIDSISNDIYKQISLEMIKCFGEEKYMSWLSNLRFDKIDNNILFVSCSNQFVIDNIKKDYLNGIQSKDENGNKYWFRKGIKQIISDFGLNDIVINFKENDQQN